MESMASLKLIEAFQVGSGRLKETKQREILQRLSRSMDGDSPARKPQPLTFGMLQQMGIPVAKK